MRYNPLILIFVGKRSVMGNRRGLAFTCHIDGFIHPFDPPPDMYSYPVSYPAALYSKV